MTQEEIDRLKNSATAKQSLRQRIDDRGGASLADAVDQFEGSNIAFDFEPGQGAAVHDTKLEIAVHQTVKGAKVARGRRITFVATGGKFLNGTTTDVGVIGVDGRAVVTWDPGAAGNKRITASYTNGAGAVVALQLDFVVA